MKIVKVLIKFASDRPSLQKRSQQYRNGSQEMPESRR